MFSFISTSQVALVIGGTNGIGRGLAEWLARQGASVVVAGRSRERGEEVVQAMTSQSPEDKSAHFSFAPIDAMKIADTNRFCIEFAAAHRRLDYLVLTPGIASTQGRTETSEGLEQKLAIHFFGRVAAIQGLLPLLEQTADAGGDVRVMSVLSAGVHAPYLGYKEDFELKESFSLGTCAKAGSLYTDVALDSLSKEHPKITFLHAAPGGVATAWGTELNPFLRGMVRFVQLFFKSPEACANAIGPGLLAEGFKGGFQMVDPSGGHVKESSEHDKAREIVWEKTKGVLARVAAANPK